MKDRVPGRPTCLDCGVVVDGATMLDDDTAEPHDGDVSVCAYCSAVALYLDDGEGGLLLRRPTSAEWHDLHDLPAVQRAIEAVTARRRAWG